MTDGDYNAHDDFERSLAECYAAVRARMAAGGPPWVPQPPRIRWVAEIPERDRADG